MFLVIWLQRYKIMTEKSMICFGFFLTLSYLCIMNLKDQRIAVLLSGGVDSSVVLYELVRQGLRPDCFYIKIGPE